MSPEEPSLTVGPVPNRFPQLSFCTDRFSASRECFSAPSDPFSHVLESTFLAAEVVFPPVEMTFLAVEIVFLAAKTAFLAVEIVSLAAEMVFLPAEVVLLVVEMVFLPAEIVLLAVEMVFLPVEIGLLAAEIVFYSKMWRFAAVCKRRARNPEPSRTPPMRILGYRNRSVASTRALKFPGSMIECPASGVMCRSASGQARWRSQALVIGQTTS
jgi:hypothetical protein